LEPPALPVVFCAFTWEKLPKSHRKTQMFFMERQGKMYEITIKIKEKGRKLGKM
jgi:hypothetical protein